MKKIKWCAVGDSFTYLNDHLDETGYRVSKGYLDRVLEQLPDLEAENIGINGSVTEDWLEEEIPSADLYTVLLGTNDWNRGVPLGTEEDFQRRRRGTILGNLGILLDHIHEAGPLAPVIVMNPVERGDFVYIGDPHNNAAGSYAPRDGQRLEDVAAGIYKTCRNQGIAALDLHSLSGFSPENVLAFKRVKKDGVYQNLPYPDYVGIPYDPDRDEYPYPEEAVRLTYDGLHPSDEGNQKIADLLAAKIREVIHLT